MKFQFLPAKLQSRGVHCDAAGCDYTDPTAQLKDMRKWLNRPCPKCGANLFTVADYRALKVLGRVFFAINLVTLPFWPVFWLHQLYLWIRGKYPVARFRAKMKGDGSVNFTDV